MSESSLISLPPARHVREPYLLTTETIEYGEVRTPTPERAAEHVLVWCALGTVSVTVGDREWLLVGGSGLWVPAGVVRTEQFSERAFAGRTFFAASRVVAPVDAPTVVDVPVALRELLIHLMLTPMPDDDRLRAQQVCRDLITSGGSVPVLELPIPRDPRLRSTVEAVLRDPSDDRSLESHAAAANFSPRTLSRAFQQNTGMSFRQWRRCVRMRSALVLLSQGRTVAEIHDRVGYATPSAFTASFREVTGRTPTEMARSA